MKKTKKVAISCIVTTILAFGCMGTAIAAPTLYSHGVIKFQEDDNSAVFDASDITAINDEVNHGKHSIGEAINNTGYGALTETTYGSNNSYTELSNAVNNNFTLPSAPTERYYISSNGSLTTDETETEYTGSWGAADSSQVSKGKMIYGSDGRLIVGTGQKEKEAYDGGKLDGMEDSSDIVINRHRHVSSCYVKGTMRFVPGSKEYYGETDSNGETNSDGLWRCDNCGHEERLYMFRKGEGTIRDEDWTTSHTCRTKCGKTQNQVESVVYKGITYLPQ